MENPYQSPEEPCAPLDWRSPMEPERRPPGLVHHVRVVAILMLVQGALELFAALAFGAFAAAIGSLMSHQEMQMQPPTAPSPEQVVRIMTVTYGVMATAALVIVALENWTTTLGRISVRIGPGFGGSHGETTGFEEECSDLSPWPAAC